MDNEIETRVHMRAVAVVQGMEQSERMIHLDRVFVDMCSGPMICGESPASQLRAVLKLSEDFRICMTGDELRNRS